MAGQRTKREWFDDDEFWVDLFPLLFTEERLAAAEPEVDALLSLAPYNGSAVLDLGCGPGRHAVALAKRGFNVTGVDRTAFLLDHARERATEQDVEVEWVRADMREFLRPEAFDLAVSMFSTLGYFEDESDDRRVLANLCASLRPGGSLVIELLGKEWMAHDFEPTITDHGPDGQLLIRRHEITDDWTRVRNEWVLLDASGTKTWRFSMTIYSGRELKERLIQAGFARVRLHGDLEGAPYGRDAKRLVAVAIKE